MTIPLTVFVACAAGTPVEDQSSVKGTPFEVGAAPRTENMLNHATAMCVLMWSTVYLDHESVHEIAELLRAGPARAAPIGTAPGRVKGYADDDRDFELRDVLSKDLAALSRSARAKDDEGMAEAFGSLIKTCVRCHSAYARASPAR